MVFGGNELTEDSSHVEIVEEIPIPSNIEQDQTLAEDDLSHMNLTQKVASILEGTVIGIYEFIVMIMYEIASIFFSIT